MQGELARDADVLLEIAELAPEVVLGDPGAADVVAERDGDALLEGCLGVGDDPLEDHVAVELLDLAGARDRAVEQRVRQRGRDRSAKERAVLLEEVHDLVGGRGTVLDGVDAALERHADAIGGLDVRGDWEPQLVGAIAHGAHHGGIHLELAGGALLLGVKHAARDHELDEVGALRARGLDLGQGLVDAVGRDGDRSRHVATRDRDALVGSQDARGLQHAGSRGVAHAGVEVAQAADGTDGGDSAVQLQTRVLGHKAVGHGTREAVGHDLLYQGLVVALLLLRLAVAHQVDVHVDETGRKVGARQVEGLATREIGLPHGTDLGDVAALDDDRVILQRLHALGTVEHAGVDVGHPPARGTVHVARGVGRVALPHRGLLPVF